MITTQPDVKPLGLYGLMDTARALGVTKSTIQKWTAAGKLPFTIRRSTGKRVWYGKDILKFWSLTL